MTTGIRIVSGAFIAAAIVVMAAGLGLFVADMATANHHRHIVDNSTYTNPGETWALRKGVVGNGATPASPQTLTWCNNLGGYASQVSTVFSDWENTISGWTQFTSNCSSNNILVAWDYGNTICGSGNWGCFDTRTNCVGCWSYDSVRQAYYLLGGIAYLNPNKSWNTTTVTEALRHEIGHGMGFDDWYLHGPPASCNSAAPSTIMDLAPNGVFFCGDGSTVTSSDSIDVNAWYGFGSVANIFGWNCSSYYARATFCVNWTDTEATDSLMYIDYWRCTDQSCSGGNTYLGAEWHSAGAGFYNASNSTSWNNGVLSGYYYWAGVSYYSAAKSYGPTTYTNVIYVSYP